MDINKIYNIDCLEGLAKIPDGSIDAIITDPPYCVGTTSNGMKGSWRDNNLIRPFFQQLFSQWKRVLKTGGTIYIDTDWRTYPILYPMIQAQFIMRNLIVWDYGLLKTGLEYRFSHELIIYATNGKHSRTFGRGEADIWRIRGYGGTAKEKVHPTQKPVPLVQKMIEDSTAPGQTVLDCFMGSGTTAIAALETGRNFIGFEIDERYYEIADNRIHAWLEEHMGGYHE